MSKKNKKKESYYFDYFKKLFDTWEESTSHAFQIWMDNPYFKKTMESAGEKSSEFKDYTIQMMERYLNKSYFLNNKDIEKIMNSIDKIESRLNKLEKTINEIAKINRQKTPKQKKGGK